MWEVRKQKLYGDDSCPQSQSSPGDLGGAAGVDGHRDGKLWEGKLYCEYLLVHVMCVLVHVHVHVHVLVGVNVR